MLVFPGPVTLTFVADAVPDPSQAEQGFHVYYQPGSSGKKLVFSPDMVLMIDRLALSEPELLFSSIGLMFCTGIPGCGEQQFLNTTSGGTIAYPVGMDTRCAWAVKSQDAQHHIAWQLTSLDTVEDDDLLYVRIMLHSQQCTYSKK